MCWVLQALEQPGLTQVQEAGVRFRTGKFIRIPSGKKLEFKPAEIREPIMNLCVNGNFQAAFHGTCWHFCSPGTLYWRLGLNCVLTVCLRVSSLPSAAGGEIFDHCVSDELLPETHITRLIRQTLEGVHQLHQNNLVHLDLKVGLCTQYRPSLQQITPQYTWYSEILVKHRFKNKDKTKRVVLEFHSKPSVFFTTLHQRQRKNPQTFCTVRPCTAAPLASWLCVGISFLSLFLSQPQNILLTGLSPLGDIKIVDFGLARKLGSVGELREILGTPEYVGE